MISKAEIRGILTGFAAVAVVLLAAISIRMPVPGQELLGSLRFHIGVALLALPVLLAIAGARWRALLLLALILASLGQGVLVVTGLLAARAPMAAQTPLTHINLLNFNVLVSNPRGAEIADYMNRTAPDIAVIMETPGLARQFDMLAATFPYRAGCAGPTECDLSLLSRTPLRDVRVLKSSSLQRERLIVAKTTINGADVTVVAVHLSKPYFDENAGVELWQVESVLRDITGPVVVSGDLNAAIWSDNVAHFVADAKLVPPPRFPATWPVRAGALGVPIDNIFSRDGALIEDISATDSSIGSNHRGLVARIAIMPPQGGN